MKIIQTVIVGAYNKKLETLMHNLSKLDVVYTWEDSRNSSPIVYIFYSNGKKMTFCCNGNNDMMLRTIYGK